MKGLKLSIFFMFLSVCLIQGQRRENHHGEEEDEHDRHFFSILQSGTILMYFFCTGLELALSCAFYMLENCCCNVSVLCGRSLWSILFWLESIHDCSVQRAFKWKQSSEFWEIKTKTLKLRTIWYFCWFVFYFQDLPTAAKARNTQGGI